jgi:hypothetical protein
MPMSDPAMAMTSSIGTKNIHAARARAMIAAEIVSIGPSMGLSAQRRKANHSSQATVASMMVMSQAGHSHPKM